MHRQSSCFLLFLFLLLLLVLFFAVTCRAYCSVSTVSGMNTADCSNRSLRSVPSTLRDDLRVFRISRNQLSELPAGSFRMYPLLGEIYAGHNLIGFVSPEAFQGLAQVKLLDLGHNLLTEVPSASFKVVPSLTVLILKGNPIAALAPRSFESLSLLLEVNLENCSISRIDERAFLGVPRLAELNLAGNGLETMAEGCLDPIRRSLSVLLLQRNPWNCDCHLRWLRLWLEMSSVVWKHSRESLVCREGPPKVKRSTWMEVDPSMFACPIKVISVGKTTVEAKIGEEVTFECVVHSDPEPSVYWRRKEEATPLPAEFKVTKNHLWTASTHEGRLLTSLTLANVSRSSLGSYVCVAENNATRSELAFQVVLHQQRLSRQGNLRLREQRDQQHQQYHRQLGEEEEEEEEDQESLRQRALVFFLLGLGVFSLVCLSVATAAILSRKCRWTNSYKVTDSDVDQRSKSLAGSCHTSTLQSQLTSPAKVNGSFPVRDGSSIKRPTDKCSFSPPLSSGDRSTVTSVNHAIPFYAVLPSVEVQRHPVASLRAGFDPILTDKTIPRNGYKTFSG